MNDLILQHWQFFSKQHSKSTIIPDGCRDLIFFAPQGAKPYWQVTKLDETSYEFCSKGGDFLSGFRFASGTLIDQNGLLRAVENLEIGQGEIEEAISQYCTTSHGVKEVLGRLSSGMGNVKSVAEDLGVCVRTLQRLLIKNTGKSASFWLGLARVRGAARTLFGPVSLSETAYEFGYCDQAHMSREIRRWFDTSPARLKYSPQILGQLKQPGYN